MRPVCISSCADCGVGCLTLGEYYMVCSNVWEQAWEGRRKPWHTLCGQQYLCVDRLEKRIGRSLTRHDFTDAPVNEIGPRQSVRLRDRLTAEWPPRKITS
jgi:hypothetical protein